MSGKRGEGKKRHQHIGLYKTRCRRYESIHCRNHDCTVREYHSSGLAVLWVAKQESQKDGKPPSAVLWTWRLLKACYISINTKDEKMLPSHPTVRFSRILSRNSRTVDRVMRSHTMLAWKVRATRQFAHPARFTVPSKAPLTYAVIAEIKVVDSQGVH